MGSVSQSPELGLALRTGSQPGAWADPSGIRGVLRHGVATYVAVVVLGAALFGAIVAPDTRVLLILLGLAVVGQLLVQTVLRRFDRPVAPEVEFRIAVVSWPLALVVLASSAWATDQPLGEIVVAVGFVMATIVALVESRTAAAAWTVAAAGAVTAGAAVTGSFTTETVITAGAIGAGALFGDRVREVLETFLGARRRLLEDVSRLPGSDDPFLSAELLLQPLLRWTPLRNTSIIWFTQDGPSIFLAVTGDGLPAAVTAGHELPEERNTLLRSQASIGPWISGWAVRGDDQGYTRDIAAAGIKAAVYVPLMFEGRVLGVVGAGLADRGDDRSAMAEYIPTLVQFADAAALELGPSLARREVDSTANRAIDEILERRRYRPVFQSVRRLSDGKVVGYEALTRFDATWTTSEVFAHARLAGRLRDLELATLEAAVRASSQLPTDRWVSLNCSSGLLVEPDTLAEIIGPVRQEVVIELSEQDVISDYEPIAGAVARLGPRCRLAVDDAGAGFASLRHILEVRPHFVKLDIGLVQGVATDLTRTALVAGFVRFAADAGFELIAEGIETDADRKALRRLGVGLGQGYLLGRPGPAAEVMEPAADRQLARVRVGRTRITTAPPAGANLHTGTIRHLPAP